MPKETSLRNVFRFVQLRPSTLLTDGDKIEIDSSTDLAKEIKSKVTIQQNNPKNA